MLNKAQQTYLLLVWISTPQYERGIANTDDFEQIRLLLQINNWNSFSALRRHHNPHPLDI